MAQDVLVETRNLTKVYRDFWGRQKKVALRALNLQIQRGEIFGLLGPNGSGKTTTIKLLLGLLFPTEGDALVFGQSAANVGKNERIGYLPEESYLYRFLNAEETLDFYGRLFNLAPAIRRKRAQDLIERVKPSDVFRDSLVNVRDGFAHALSAKALVVAVAQFPGFMFAGARTAWHDGASRGTTGQRYFRFDRWVATRIDYLASFNLRYLRHAHFGRGSFVNSSFS